jgi:hypothetical protein
MSQGSLNVPTVGPVSPTSFAGDINAALDAVISKNSGGSAPANFPTTGGTPTSFQDWMNTTAPTLVQANLYDGVSWCYRGTLDTTNHVWKPKLHAGTAISTVSLTTNTNDWDPVRGSSNRVPVTASGAINITGMVAGKDGDIAIVEVLGSSSNITFTANDSNSAAANRFLIPFSLTMHANQTVAFYYSAAVSGWRLMTSPPNSGITYQAFTAGTAQTYTRPPGCTAIKVRMVGGGGGGGGTAGTATVGGATSFNSISAAGGNPGANGANGAGGAISSAGTGGANLRIAGQAGAYGSSSGNNIGGFGGSSVFGGGGQPTSAVGGNAVPHTGSGGAGAGGIPGGAGGGAAGEYVEIVINQPAATYVYTVGAAGAPATNGGNPAAGQIVVEEYYS